MTPDPRHGALLRRWGRFTARHARATLVFWLLFVIAGFGAATGRIGGESLFDRLHSGEITVPGENMAGRDVLEEAGGSAFSTYTLTLQGVDLADPKVAAAAASAVREISALPHIQSAVNPFVVPGGPSSPQAAPYLAHESPTSDGFATVVRYSPDLAKADEASTRTALDAIFDRLATDTNARVAQRGGIQPLVERIVGQVQTDLKRGEGIALPVSFLLMLIVFGGFVAAGLPIIGAIASIAGGLAALLGFSHLIDLDASVVNVVTVLGLGLCIDYGLLMVSRFREEMRRLAPGVSSREVTRDQVHLALEHAVDRAGRTIIFSAVTVAIALAGLYVFDIEFVRAVSAASVSVVLVALAVALSLIPAACVVGARRILRRGTEISGDHGVFSRLAERVHRMPWAVIVVVTIVLGVLASPALGLRIVSSGADLLPKGTAERTFFEDLPTTFPGLAGPDLTVVSTAPAAELTAWAAEVARRPGVTQVSPPRELDAGVRTLGLRVEGGPVGDTARDLVTALRTDRPPGESWVVGQASGLHDFSQAVRQRVFWAIGLVMLATLVLLFLMTGSLVIPVKALVMNVLSLGAALGVLVWVFQNGHLDAVLGFTSVGAIEATIPLIVLAFGFGLSMDYEVFLLARIVELHEQGHDTETAVTLGLQRSGRIITSAALLIMIVFAGFAAGELLMIKEMGLALTLAVFIDATLVRMLLVPATMSVLGSANWWAPAPAPIAQPVGHHRMILRLESLAELVEATERHPVVVFDAGRVFDGPAFALGPAPAASFAFARSFRGARWPTFVGPREGVAALLADDGVRAWAFPPGTPSVWMPQGHLDLLGGVVTLGDGGDWEWMLTRTAPPVLPGESRLIPLGPDAAGELTAFLAEHNPRTHGAPFRRPDQIWIGVRGADGALIACGCSEPSWTEVPALAGITVAATARGTGLGAAVTARLTREGVERTGACTLGMYSDNAVARRVYHSLGYRTLAEWSTRQIVAD